MSTRGGSVPADTAKVRLGGRRGLGGGLQGWILKGGVGEDQSGEQQYGARESCCWVEERQQRVTVIPRLGVSPGLRDVSRWLRSDLGPAWRSLEKLRSRHCHCHCHCRCRTAPYELCIQHSFHSWSRAYTWAARVPDNTLCYVRCRSVDARHSILHIQAILDTSRMPI